MTGWCGDFDNNPNNDDIGNNGANSRESSVSGNEDLFRRGANLLQTSSTEVQDLPPMDSPTPKQSLIASKNDDDDDHEEVKHPHDTLTVKCAKDLLNRARHACKAIAEREMRRACIFDVCALKDTEVAEEEYEMEVLEVLDGRGVPVFVDTGFCQDVNGKR